MYVQYVCILYFQRAASAGWASGGYSNFSDTVALRIPTFQGAINSDSFFTGFVLWHAGIFLQLILIFQSYSHLSPKMFIVFQKSLFIPLESKFWEQNRELNCEIQATSLSRVIFLLLQQSSEFCHKYRCLFLLSETSLYNPTKQCRKFWSLDVCRNSGSLCFGKV